MVLQAKEPLATHDHPGGWNQSRPSPAPRLYAWLFAIAVVALLAVGLHALYY